MSEIHTTLTVKQDTPNPTNPGTGPVPFQAVKNADNNPNNANSNTFFTGDQANTEVVVSAVINVPDGVNGSSSVSPNNVSPGPVPSPTPGEAFETNNSTRASGLIRGGNSTGIFEYDGTPNVTPQDAFANAINKFPPREG